MNRTDLAIELKEQASDLSGIESQTVENGLLTVTKIKVTSEKGSKTIGRPIGTYINIDVPDLCLHGGEYGQLEEIIIEALNGFKFPKNNNCPNKCIFYKIFTFL